MDWRFIAGQEGGQKLMGYVPHRIALDPRTHRSVSTAIGRSGVTVATGVDLGQYGLPDLDALALSPALKAKLTPYVGKVREEALRALEALPLTLSHQEADQLDGAVQSVIAARVRRIYDAALDDTPGLARFDDLPVPAQTVILSISYQYGPNFGRALPRIWDALIAQNWPRAEHELRDPGLQYRDRRTAEAHLLSPLGLQAQEGLGRSGAATSLS